MFSYWIQLNKYGLWECERGPKKTWLSYGLRVVADSHLPDTFESIRVVEYITELGSRQFCLVKSEDLKMHNFTYLDRMEQKGNFAYIKEDWVKELITEYLLQSKTTTYLDPPVTKDNLLLAHGIAEKLEPLQRL